METNDILKRAADLADRCERSGTVTATGFLTPAEQYELGRWAEARPDLTLRFHGGTPDSERRRAFFLPDWMDPGDLDPADHIRAVRVRAQFGEPGHRDYMGAALGLGVRRESLGDIRVDGTTAYLLCLPTVEPLLLEELDKAGRTSLRTEPCPLDQIPVREREVRTVRFTVKSLRLDAVAAGMFGLSRTAAAELIRLGAASLNYTVCDRVDAPVKEGDVLSLRGRGKGQVTSLGGRSRKDRQFLEAEIWL